MQHEQQGTSGHAAAKPEASDAKSAAPAQKAAPKEPETPELGTMVTYTENGVASPAMVIGAHDNGTIDLCVFLGYAQGLTDRQNVALSDLGASGTYMPAMPKAQREEKIKAALEKKAKEEEKANADAEKEREKQQKEKGKQISSQVAELHKRTGELEAAVR